MGFPVIKHPAVLIEIPSLKKQLRFRPFTVAEERILLLGASNANQSPVLNIKQVINNCALEDLDVDKLPLFDIEYLFIKLRAVSVSNVLSLTIGGEEVQVNLDDVKVHYPDTGQDNKVILDASDGIGVVLGYPLLADADRPDADKADRLAILQLIIRSVFRGAEVFDVKDYSKEELDTFINSLRSAQVNQLLEWANNIPYVYLDVALSNGTVRRLRGIESFFG